MENDEQVTIMDMMNMNRWPCFEDGEPVMFGDKIADDKGNFAGKVIAISIYDNGTVCIETALSFLEYEYKYGYGERVKRYVESDSF